MSTWDNDAFEAAQMDLDDPDDDGFLDAHGGPQGALDEDCTQQAIQRVRNAKYTPSGHNIQNFGGHGVLKQMICIDCWMQILSSIVQAKAHGWNVWVGGARCKACEEKVKV